MSIGWRLAWADLRSHRRLVSGLVVLVFVPLYSGLLLGGYGRSIETIERRVRPLLVVQEANTVGEIAGSRIPASTAQVLRRRGVSDAVAEVHAVTGERIDLATLVRGVELDRYRDIESPPLVAGRLLSRDDPPRSVLVGERLADRRGVGVGDVLPIRGRDFTVVGVFALGTFADNEAWVPIGAAQEVLGWGSDVSLFVIPDEGVLRPGDALPGGLVVAQRGDIQVLAHEWLPLLRLIDVAVRALEVGAAVIVVMVLWRITWLRRRELGVVRLVGLPRATSSAYLLSHALAIVPTAMALGWVLAAMTARLVVTERFGFPVESRIDAVVVARTLGSAAAVFALGLIVPLVRLHRQPLAGLLRSR